MSKMLKRVLTGWLVSTESLVSEGLVYFLNIRISQKKRCFDEFLGIITNMGQWCFSAVTKPDNVEVLQRIKPNVIDTCLSIKSKTIRDCYL